MENLERSFDGVFIPAFIWLDKRLNALEKIILTEINSLDNGKNGCYASNAYLADFCGCSETKISTAISKLKELDFIELENFDGRHRLLKIKSQPLKNLKADFKNFKPDNIYINNIDYKSKLDKSNLDTRVEKKISKKDLILKENVECIIEYLNNVANTNYKPSTKGTIDLIKARFKEGYVLDDFYDVIDNKWKEWKDTEWQKYMRPQTLFGNKFESYLNGKIFNGKPKISYGSKPTFDNTVGHNVGNPKISDEEIDKMSFEQKRNYIMGMAYADMTYKQKEFFNKYCLAMDENGNLLKF